MTTRVPLLPLVLLSACTPGSADLDVAPQAEVALKTESAARAPQRNEVESPAAVLELPEHLRMTLAKTTVPLLVPREPSLLAHAVPTAGTDWYALAIMGEGFGVQLAATRKQVPGAPGKASEAVSHAEGVARLSFQRFGAAYLLEVECNAPETDPRCRNDEFIRQLQESLVVAGGR